MSDAALQTRAEAAEAQLNAQGPDTVTSNAIDNNILIPCIDNLWVPKLPPFSQVDPELWFIQAEILMRNSRITTESTKADTVLAALDVEVLGYVKDIITLNPSPTDIYEQIKARIIAAYAPSVETKLRKLLTGQVGTDGKPSLILSRLRSLNDGNIDDSVIKSIFLDHLPPKHRAILVALVDVTDLNRLAEAADRMAESNIGGESYASAVNKGNTPPPAKTEIQQFIERMEKLEKLGKTLNSHSRSNSRSVKNPKN
ncbi:uncharacterized protein LOC112459384 [Temnothorax curvispinosus]|uniref:Uncharacterized protein LOC112459384 n=1 Tax=Temnothorax curvispinosus TaxID=300111 RepID=A0A6J1QBY6_9HYME|nr:uncharacterized protein LOC112459384 [Temnothorax curvispinosus]